MTRPILKLDTTLTKILGKMQRKHCSRINITIENMQDRTGLQSHKFLASLLLDKTTGNGADIRVDAQVPLTIPFAASALSAGLYTVLNKLEKECVKLNAAGDAR